MKVPDTLTPYTSLPKDRDSLLSKSIVLEITKPDGSLAPPKLFKKSNVSEVVMIKKYLEDKGNKVIMKGPMNFIRARDEYDRAKYRYGVSKYKINKSIV